ncbi:MAG: hypothetical protein RBT33_02440 [Candidatus Dojkabacteria bacterium]|jgi:DNA polymerase III gamma/tau subunit|nr:hypothetical protein [Candidatus Dojkabacteria bacterium]
MTYLIVGKEKKNINDILNPLLSKLWSREVKDSELFDSTNPDIHVVDGREVNSIGIEEIKELQKEMMYSPFKERVQVAYILDANKLTTQAQNSLLKTLEESSDSTVYILIAQIEKSLLPTVLSRCLKIYTHAATVRSETFIKPDILSMDLIEAFAKIEVISKEKSSVEELLANLEHYYQDLLERNLVEKKGIIEISLNIKQILLAQKRIKANGNKRLVLENLFLHLNR